MHNYRVTGVKRSWTLSFPGRKRVCIRNLARLQRSTREIPVSFLFRETFVARYAFWFHGLVKGLERNPKYDTSVFEGACRGAIITRLMRFPAIRSIVIHAHFCGPRRAAVLICNRQMESRVFGNVFVGRNRGPGSRKRRHDDPRSPPRRESTRGCILSPRKTSKETGSRVIKSISRPVFPPVLLSCSLSDRSKCPLMPFFHFLTSLPLVHEEGRKKTSRLISKQQSNKGEFCSFRSKKIFNYILQLIYFSELPMREWIRENFIFRKSSPSKGNW